MIAKEVEEKFQNHLSKADSYKNDSLRDVFDRFRSLYICYNILFNLLPELLIKKGIELKKQTDTIKATEGVQFFLGGKLIIETVTKQNQNEIDELISIMENGLFHISLNSKGEAIEGADEGLLAGLRSQDQQQKSISLLQVIYRVRCNESHGSKDFEEHQRLLLIPLSAILRTIVNLLHENLLK